MPLEKALIKLREEGAELGYRPDQLPQLAVKVPGGQRRTLGGWLSFLLQGTEITYEPTSVGYLLYPDPGLPRAHGQTCTAWLRTPIPESDLLGAAVQIPDEGKGVAANEYGFLLLARRTGAVARSASPTSVISPKRYSWCCVRDSSLNFERYAPTGTYRP